MTSSIHSKYALVTGASSGIGWHLSMQLAQGGYNIVAASDEIKGLQELKQLVESKYQVEVRIIDIDLSNTDAAMHLFEFCKANKLAVEVLVNNAGNLLLGEAINLTASDSQSNMQLQMITPVLLCQLFGHEMIKNQKGFILNVSSISAVMALPIISLYGPTNGFLRQFTNAFRIEMKHHKVGVTCLIPGATDTPLLETHKLNLPVAKSLGVISKPEWVARKGINALFNNRKECIPGLLNKIIVLLVPIIPKFIIRIIYNKLWLSRTE
jgi:short-subunit dehydrogenase